MKVLQINTTINTGSTGRIAEAIGRILIAKGYESYIAHGRVGGKSESRTIKIGTTLDQQLHGLKTRLTDRHAFGSRAATKKLIREIDDIQPDIIHLHNLHGYYIHIGVLFTYLKKTGIPVLWTLHDCWPFTGHCSYFDFVKCDKWKTHCSQCPLSTRYPESWFVDNSSSNFDKKKALFNGVNNLRIVTPSYWLKELLKESFLHPYPVSVIHNGVDLECFKPTDQHVAGLKNKLALKDEFLLLGVASVWDRRKGLKDFIQLSGELGNDYRIILVGLSGKLQEGLPQNIIALDRTESLDEMVALYNMADVFINPTWVDNFPSTNIEALACGTPVITYRTGGSVEAIDEHTGFIIEKGDIHSLLASINKVKLQGKQHFKEKCRERAAFLFHKEERFGDYIRLYQSVLSEAEPATN